ncbi:MAG: hypothetical protein R3C18_01030 [Planctomycetaceae bacterium]
MHRRLIAHILGLIVIPGCLATGAAWAQGQAPGRSTIPPVANNPDPIQRPPQPAQQGQPEAKREVSPELEQILVTWEKYSVKLTKLEGAFEKYDYDFVFKIEKRSEGRYYYEEPDKGRMDFFPPKQLPETNETRGVVFQVKPNYTQSWICTGKEILDINHDEKTYNMVDIPARFQGQNIIESPLPFLFGMKAEEMKKRYLMTLGDMHNPQKGVIHIVAAPLQEAQQREYRRVEVLLSTADFLPTAVRLWGASGNNETVYVFTKHATRKLPWLPQSPFQGRLPAAYKLLDHMKAPPPQQNVQMIIPNGQIQRTVEAPGRNTVQ